jgi:hypothetical protein
VNGEFVDYGDCGGVAGFICHGISSLIRLMGLPLGDLCQNVLEVGFRIVMPLSFADATRV